MNRNRKYSYVCPYPLRKPPGACLSTKVALGEYCLSRNISKKQSRTLIRRRWLAASKWRGRIYVEEVCPERIEQWLGGYG